MDKDKKEKIREKFNEVTEKVYDSANIKGSLDNMYINYDNYIIIYCFYYAKRYNNRR